MLVSFIAFTASLWTRFSTPSTAFSPVGATARSLATITSPSLIAFAATFNFAPPPGPFCCTMKPALCSEANNLRTITGPVPSASASVRDVCSFSGASANFASSRTLIA